MSIVLCLLSRASLSSRGVLAMRSPATASSSWSGRARRVAPPDATRGGGARATTP